MKKKTTPKARANQARALWTDKCMQHLERTSVLRFNEHGGVHVNQACAVIPTPTQKEAKALVRFFNLKEGKRLSLLERSIANAGDWSFGREPSPEKLAHAILATIKGQKP